MYLFDFSKGVAPGQLVTEKITITPKYPGNRELIVCFNSRQLTGMTGVVEMQITE